MEYHFVHPNRIQLEILGAASVHSKVLLKKLIIVAQILLKQW